MLTKLIIHNFKRFEQVEIELGSPVIFIGPNNSGKTSAMQALALWDTGLKRWHEKRSGKTVPARRSGVTVNRRDLVAIPTSRANLLWHDLHVRNVDRSAGRQRTSNIRIDLIVEGVTGDKAWTCGLEFDYANEESFYCRPLRQPGTPPSDRMPVPDEAEKVQIAFLPPMSGLAAEETRLDSGAINVRIGEGRMAEVLRNLCFRVFQDNPAAWQKITHQIRSLFGADLLDPQYVEGRGEIVMTCQEGGIRLDLASAGRGLHQTLLLLAYMYANPGTVMLLDEPDAHLEILRQRQTYRLLTEVARESGSQIIAASHSEVLLNEAAGKDLVVAFVGVPHRIDGLGSQVLKALNEIGFEQYYQAEQTGWVLYLEGSTDLAVLQALARRLDYGAAVKVLERPFVRYVSDQPNAVRRHFHGLREALPHLQGIALFDRLDRPPPDISPITLLMWQRREIENYICTRATLESFATSAINDVDPESLFWTSESERRREAMQQSIAEIERALQTLGRESPWSPDIKASDAFLAPLFQAYFRKLGLPNLMGKKAFYELAEFVPDEELDPEIQTKLESIVQAAERAAALCPQTNTGATRQG